MSSPDREPSPDLTAWLIEWPADDNMPPRWWHPKTGWMLDASKASRFARKEDAEAFIREGRFCAGMQATEHKWIGAAPSPSPDVTLEPVAWITKAGLTKWLAGTEPESHVLLRSGNDLREPLVRQSDALQALQAAENRLANERSFGKHAITSLQAAEAEIERLKAENTRIRAALAVSKDPCIYCSLPAEDWAKCQHGFPGCDRGDDAMGCQELGASLALKDAEAQRDAAEAARSAAEAREAELRKALNDAAVSLVDHGAHGAASKAHEALRASTPPTKDKADE